MRTPRPNRLAAAFGLGLLVLAACGDGVPDALTAPVAQTQLAQEPGQDIPAAIAAQQRHTAALMRIPGVVGTAVGRLPNGRAAVRLFLEHADVPGLPSVLDGVPVTVTVSGRFVARSDPTLRARPAPIGYSVGHPDITAGTIAARVRDGAGNRFGLSNNHVLANSNNAGIGDPTLQPGPFDGGTTANDQIGTLAAFQSINFSGGNNTIDAAIFATTTEAVGNATPADEGYGTANSAIFGDANNDGRFDNIGALLGLGVQKYGRTTRHTHGQITGINATVTVCYEVFIIFCVLQATFVDQVIVEPGAFSGAGDSGSLIVSDDANRNPVGLLFAGSDAQTIANRIDLVLNAFGVTVDGGAAPPPPTPVTDIAISGVSAPGSAAQGATVNVVVSIANTGNQAVGATFDVTLRDATDDVVIGTQSVAGLATGVTTTRTFPWNTTGRSLGVHTLTASHTLVDDNPTNDSRSTAVTVNPPSVGMHIGDLDALTSNDGATWSAVVEITVHDANHQPLNGATVVGSWNTNGLNSNTCTSGDLGGIGTCIVLFPSLRKRSVTFTVNSVTRVGYQYQKPNNHDVDGGSNGTSIKVNRP